jgi:hypothetical protein
LKEPVIFFAMLQLLCWPTWAWFRVRGPDLGGWRPPSPPTLTTRYLNLLHLRDVQLDWRGPTEDRYGDLQP